RRRSRLRLLIQDGGVRAHGDGVRCTERGALIRASPRSNSPHLEFTTTAPESARSTGCKDDDQEGDAGCVRRKRSGFAASARSSCGRESGSPKLASVDEKPRIP